MPKFKTQPFFKGTDEYSNGYWLGYRNEGGEKFVWNDQSDNKFQNWAPNEPSFKNKGEPENCIMMYPSSPERTPKIIPQGYARKWNDMICNGEALGYVCKLASFF